MLWNQKLHSTICFPNLSTFQISYIAVLCSKVILFVLPDFGAASGCDWLHHITRISRSPSKETLSRSSMIPASVMAIQTTASVLKTNSIARILLLQFYRSIRSSWRIFLRCLFLLRTKQLMYRLLAMILFGYLSKIQRGCNCPFTLHHSIRFKGSPLFY